MVQRTMTEKELYLGAKLEEDQTTLKVLRAYPPDKIDFKPHPTSQTAGQIAWTLALGHMVLDPLIAGELVPTGFPPPPATWQAILDTYESAHRDAMAKVSQLKDEDFNGMIRMPLGPGRMGERRRGEALWYFLHDGIHHRGQLSVYLRTVGGKVPSIYGPSGDEPWF